MRRICQSTILVILGLLIASLGLASVLAPPSNLGDLARISRTVVFAEAEGVKTELHGETPYTVTKFRTLQQIAGQAVGRSIEVQEAGGVVGDLGMAVTGAPVFHPGGRYLLFLDPATGGRWQTKMLAYGILREEGGVLRPIPQAADLSLIARPGVEPVGEYGKAELLQHLSAVAAGVAPWHAAAVAVGSAGSGSRTIDPKVADPGGVGGTVPNAPAACRFVQSPSGVPLRWFGFETGGSTPIWHTTPGQTGISDGGVAAVQQAAAAWDNRDNFLINLAYAGSKPTTASCASGDGRARNNEVVFNDPCHQIPDLAVCTGSTPAGWSSPCCGQVAVFGTFYTESNVASYDGQTWHPAEALSVIVNNGSQCLGDTDFKEMLTHFVGHGLAFAHHDDVNATMYGELGVHASRGATLATTDRICAAFAYHTFLDVPYSRWSWQYIEALQNAGITNGCGGGNFCPDKFLTRAEMAVTLIRATHGPSFVPPPATGIFGDVPVDYWAAPQIEQLYHDGLTNGCSTSSLQYCPEGHLTRAEMVNFLMRYQHGPDFVPPPATGIFADIPPNHWAIEEAEQGYRDGTTNGCNTNPLRFCPDDDLPREQMAAFIVKAFHFPLPVQ
jgi:hypothetical protein